MFCGKAFTSVTRPLFHDANSKRDGVLMHSKVSSQPCPASPLTFSGLVWHL